MALHGNYTSPGWNEDSFPRDTPFIIVQREPWWDRHGEKYFRVSFECSHCFVSYRLDGTPRKNSRRRTHIHGESGDWDGGPTHRWAHCYRETPFTARGYFMVWEGYAGIAEFTEAVA